MLQRNESTRVAGLRERVSFWGLAPSGREGLG